MSKHSVRVTSLGELKSIIEQAEKQGLTDDANVFCCGDFGLSVRGVKTDEASYLAIDQIDYVADEEQA